MENHGHYLSIRFWKPDFNSEKAEIDKIAACVRLPSLAIEYYEEQMLRQIGNIIGRTLRVDTYTVEKCRDKFVRLCVELDLIELLVAQYAINEVRYLVEYEGIHNICFACRMVEHKKQRCPKKVQNKPPGSTEQQHARMNQEGERMKNQQSREEDRGKKGKGKEVQEEQREAFGLWIIVQKTTRGRKTVKEGVGTVSGVDGETSKNGKKVVSGMKFVILNDEEATNANDGAMGPQEQNMERISIGPNINQNRPQQVEKSPNQNQKLANETPVSALPQPQKSQPNLGQDRLTLNKNLGQETHVSKTSKTHPNKNNTSNICAQVSNPQSNPNTFEHNLELDMEDSFIPETVNTNEEIEYNQEPELPNLNSINTELMVVVAKRVEEQL
ncbi:uncharacterized protein LOC107460681 [Arachis duranensis]|uniref:Uncharacterized protein LOC107460681 n=1 Tax=Arachis duranensis TaxID=130453 RepID=A0A6P4BA65_ARADU|nr:uncharacterized protein LOC107460681 [Arachis duranensis]